MPSTLVLVIYGLGAILLCLEFHCVSFVALGWNTLRMRLVGDLFFCLAIAAAICVLVVGIALGFRFAGGNTVLQVFSVAISLILAFVVWFIGLTRAER